MLTKSTMLASLSESEISGKRYSYFECKVILFFCEVGKSNGDSQIRDK